MIVICDELLEYELREGKERYSESEIKGKDELK